MAQSAAPWRSSFSTGVAKFKLQQYEEAVEAFTKAVNLAEDKAYNVYDSRAAVYLKLGNTKAALYDAKKVIDIAPEQWQGYARAARAFLLLDKCASAMKMADLALERMGDSQKNVEQRRLLEDIRRDAAVRAVRPTNPFAQLAVEVIGMIFEFAVSRSPGVAVTLSHVCRHWRSIALAQRSLWGALILSQKKPARKAKTWIDRAAGRIAELTIDELLGQHWTELGQAWAIGHRDPQMTELRTQLKTLDWSRLSVLRLNALTLELLVDNMRTAGAENILETLEELDISIKIYNGQTFPILRPGLTKPAPEIPPNLRILKLSNLICDWTQLATHHTLVSLSVYYQLRMINSSPIRRLLEKNLSLESLILHFQLNVPFPVPRVETAASLIMARLRFLELTGLTGLTAVLDGLHLPALETLHLHTQPDATRVLAAIIEDTQNNVRGLTELSIRSCSVDRVILSRFLIHADSLQRLELSNGAFSIDKTVEVLTKPPAEMCTEFNREAAECAAVPIACPALTDVNLSNCEDLRSGPLVRMVSARRALSVSVTSADGDVAPDAKALPPYPVAPLKTLRVDGCPRIEADTLPWLRSVVPVFSCRYSTKQQAKARR
ncbi:hypothetical protein BV25DRAFT_1832541 [Artomyces pyxidatus]|uniref:Uncharacterized protein n=1 Tax=Artomyces pyxidatus TaxID=48021 RepID=A0ACB8SJG4_9AGAM|nr:hypothetical protein BV25DRAFT_1832541 [Artomyces pyxidatus]